MKQRILPLLFAVVMLLSALLSVGCNRTTNDGTTTPAETTAATETPTKPTETVEPAEELTTITILCKAKNTHAVSLAHYDENPRWEQIETIQLVYDQLEEVGIQLEFEVIDDELYNEAVKTRLMTGTDLPDIIADPGLSIVEAVGVGEAGIVAEVTELLEQYDEDGSIRAYWNKAVGACMAEITTENGDIYWMPYTYSAVYLNDDGSEKTENFDVTFHVSVREDWMNAIGEQFSMFYTTEELADLLISFYENDANGNGIKDEVIGNFDTCFNTGFEAGFDMAVGLVNVRNDGKGVQCNLYNENFADYIRFLQKLYNAGCIDTTVLNGTNVKSANRASTIYSYSGETWEEAAITGYEETAVYSPIIIDDDKGETGYCLAQRDNKTMIPGKWFVNAKSENLEAVVKLFDYIYTDEFSHLVTFGREGINYTLDEKGSKVTVVNDNSARMLTPTGILVNNALPHVYMNQFNRDEFISAKCNKPEKYQAKNDMILWIFDNDDRSVFTESKQPLAMPTGEERDTIERLENTLLTYINEMMLKLIIGEYSLDDYSDYLAELENLGLKEYISVYEAQHARWLAVAEAIGQDSAYN